MTKNNFFSFTSNFFSILLNCKQSMILKQLKRIQKKSNIEEKKLSLVKKEKRGNFYDEIFSSFRKTYRYDY